MALKKRTTLRQKSAKSATSKTSISSKISELTNDNDSYHENPFLKLLKVSKKDKQQEKSDIFVKKIEVSGNTTGGISKSALRRRKRKSKEELKPKMNELLTSLDVDTSTTKIVERKFVESSKVNKNLPNAAKRTGHLKILSQENKNFNQVLQNPQFRTSPFDALKQAISNNLKK